jgi:hypothetical protein
MLLAGGGAAPRILAAAGVRIGLAGSAILRSDVPLGFALQSEGSWPLLVSGDPTGLDRLPALSSVYRVHSWLAELDTAPLHSWELSGLERRLAHAQVALLAESNQFGMTAPFAGLDAARAQAAAAPRSLLLAAGGAISALALFVMLAAAALRREQLQDLARLRAGGATALQLGVFVTAEALALCAVALMLGFAGALGAGAVAAAAVGEPVGAVLAHSLLTPAAALALAGGWLAGAALVATASQLRTTRILNLAAIAAAAGLAAGLVLGAGDTGRSAVLLAPACCVAAGVVVFRVATWLLPRGERLTRRATAGIRLAVIGLARAPGPPAVAIAFMCVALALGGFALAYHATLERGATDRAADRVPLDALVSPGPSFATPLELEALSGWRAISRGQVFPVRRTQANYQAGSSTVTVPALGVPAGALTLIHGWRSGDGSAPLPVLAHRLLLRGLVRAPGPTLTSGARRLSLTANSPQMAVGVTADLRDPAGEIRRVALGTANATRRVLTGRVPPGRWEVQALELEEGTGLEVTNAHQNGESATPATQFTADLELGPIVALGARARPVERLPIDRWVGVGAALAADSTPGSGARIRFQASGLLGVLRPRQPTDALPVPVLADPQTATAAGTGGRLQLTVDGQPVRARVVGLLRRFPTLSGATSFVVADEAVLAAALDAQLPGQGRPDELWIAGRRTGTLRAAMGRRTLVQLRVRFRADIERALARAPIARAVTGTLLAAAGVSGALALIGLLLVVQGPFRDRRLEEDLAAQGLGPKGLRTELRTKLILAGGMGIVPGVGLSLLLDRLAVAAAGSLGPSGPPIPPLVTVVPAGPLGAWTAGMAAGVLAVAMLCTWWLIREQRGHPGPNVPMEIAGEDVLREEWAR